MIDVRHVTVRYGGVVALDDVSLHLTANVIGLIGPNGAGKTTLINAFSGFAPVVQGSIGINGQNLLTMAPHLRARWGLARSFQKVQIVPDLTVEDHLTAVLDSRRESRARKAEVVVRVLEYLDMTPIRRTLGARLNQYQARMTEIGRCLVGSPRIILLDEPGGGLSEAEMARLRKVITGIHPEFGAQVLLVDHDVELIRDVCTVTAVLDFGKLIAFGPTEEVLADEVVKSAYLGRGVS
jgi:branched-chain amino acid transport system ATP-binding protein